MSDCVFCKIVKGEIPSSKVYEDGDVLAFLDISPINKGHTLIIPKEHHETILDTPDDLLKKVIIVVKKVSSIAMKESEGVTIGQNNKPAGGQVVPHLHFHVIPRFKQDPHEHNWERGSYEEGEIKVYSEKIANLLKLG